MCLVQSQMDYCCEIWGNRFNSHIELITKVQKRAARLILKCIMFTSSKEMFSKLKLMPFKQRVQYFKCLFDFKFINNLSSEFYADILKLISEIHCRDTRSHSNNNLAILKCRTEYYNHALRCSGSVLWNDLPTEFKQKNSVESFNMMLKKHLFTVAYE